MANEYFIGVSGKPDSEIAVQSVRPVPVHGRGLFSRGSGDPHPSALAISANNARHQGEDEDAIEAAKMTMRAAITHARDQLDKLLDGNDFSDEAIERAMRRLKYAQASHAAGGNIGFARQVITDKLESGERSRTTLREFTKHAQESLARTEAEIAAKIATMLRGD
jgi:hypothetical protein